MTIDVRRVRDDEFDAWSDAIDIGFISPQNRGDGPRRRPWFDLERCWGAFDEGTPVGSLRGIDLELTVPGGAAVRTDAISAVTVAPTHRRQGLLRRMMTGELEAARERGEPLAALIAAEYPIYGRFGYAPATEIGTCTLDATAARFVRELPGTVEIVDVATAHTEGAAVYDAVRALTPGAVSRTGAYWERQLGLAPREGEPSTKNVLHALCRDGDGRAVGYVAYKFGPERWIHGRPNNQVEALDLFAVNVEYEARLWKVLADHDWVVEVFSTELRRADELWRDLLVNRRAAWPSELWEGVWVRVLDAPAALGARRYEVPGRIVLRIVDKDGYADGTFALEGGPDGAACSRTAESAEVTLPVDVLAAIYLGGFSAARFERLGRIEEHAPGAVDRLTAMFRTAIAPWTPTTF